MRSMYNVLGHDFKRFDVCLRVAAAIRFLDGGGSGHLGASQETIAAYSKTLGPPFAGLSRVRDLPEDRTLYSVSVAISDR